MKRIFPILFLILALTSCRTTHTATREHSASRDTLYKVLERHDTLILRDSVSQSLMQRGDTVFLTCEKWRTLYRTITRRDTLYKAKRDTLRVSVEKVVQAAPSAWARVKSAAAVPLAVLAVLLGGALAWIRGK